MEGEKMTPEEMQVAIEALQGLSNTNLEIFIIGVPL